MTNSSFASDPFEQGISSGAGDNPTPRSLEFLLDIPLELTVELGRTRMPICEILKLTQGSIIELGKQAGESLDIMINNKLVARGEAVSVNERFGIRISEILSPKERVEKLSK